MLSSVVNPNTNPDSNPKRTWVIRSPRSALLSDTIVGEGIREGTKGLLAAATAAALVINRVVNSFEEANEETRNEHNTMSYECTRILLNDTNSMTIQRG